MTVSLEGAIQVFLGLSTDSKPTDCPPGSRFFEFDTPAWFIFDGENWHDQTPS